MTRIDTTHEDMDVHISGIDWSVARMAGIIYPHHTAAPSFIVANIRRQNKLPPETTEQYDEPMPRGNTTTTK